MNRWIQRNRRSNQAVCLLFVDYGCPARKRRSVVRNCRDVDVASRQPRAIESVCVGDRTTAPQVVEYLRAAKGILVGKVIPVGSPVSNRGSIAHDAQILCLRFALPASDSRLRFKIQERNADPLVRNYQLLRAYVRCDKHTVSNRPEFERLPVQLLETGERPHMVGYCSPFVAFVANHENRVVASNCAENLIETGSVEGARYDMS